MSINQCSELADNGMVYAIHKGSQYDGPGLRTVILFKGCSFSCWWCPNPELQSYAAEMQMQEALCVRCGRCIAVCPLEAAREAEFPDNEQNNTIDREICIVCGACIGACAGHARTVAGRCMSVDEVMEQIAPDRLLFQQSGGGVTFAGGEPFMQPDFLNLLLRACKALGIHTVVGTSGYTPWEFLDRVHSMVDLFIFDLKLMDVERHRQFTGLPNGLILANLKMLSQLGHRITLRVPVIPGITDDADNMRAMIDFALQLPNLENIELLPYRQIAKEKYERLGKLYRMTSLQAPDRKVLDSLLHQFRASGLSTVISGADQTEQVL